MRIVYYLLVLLVVVSFGKEVAAQQLKENEIVVIQGEKYVLHQVRTGETLYSISRQFRVDAQLIVEHNPQIKEGLKIGEVLKIPFREEAEWQNLPASKKGDPTYFEYYTISSRRETPYFVAKEFGITVEEIYAYNPKVKRFRKGTKLRIPRWEQVKAEPEKEVEAVQQREEEQERELMRYEVQPGETLYSLSKRYNISESEILFLNPGARKLKSGSVIYLPKTDSGLTFPQSPEKPSRVDKNVPLERGAFFEHTIVSGETLWSLARKYDVSEAELKRLNPMLETSFPAGAAIRVPVKEENIGGAEPVNEDAFLKHEVRPGETLFGLAARYNMDIPEIRKFNPQLENRNLVRGEIILIPRTPEEEIVPLTEKMTVDSVPVEAPRFEDDYYKIEVPEIIPENCRPSGSRFFSTAEYNVALFLPLFVYTNDTLNSIPEKILAGDSLLLAEEELVEDTLVEVDEPKEIFHGFYRESENFLEFYEGVLLAVDSLQRAGMQIRLHVFDTRQKADSIREVIHSPQFLETDLIIGPVYPQVQDEVADIAAKNRIPFISPLSSQSRKLEHNPYYFQVNPSREFLAEKTAELITEEYFNSNFVVIKTSHSGGSTEEKVIDIVREKMLGAGYLGHPQGMRFNIYDFEKEGPFGLSRIFSHEKENVVFVASMNEGDLSVVLSNINNLGEEYSITLIGSNRYEQFHSITDEFFHNLKLQYIAPYWVDYSHPETIRFLKKFREHFHIEPGNFGMQGYDVAFFFLNALKNYGKDFEECLMYQQVHLSQGNYRFEKVSRFGGYMNQGVSVISYERDFDVVRKRVIGPYRFAQK